MKWPKSKLMRRMENICEQLESELETLRMKCRISPIFEDIIVERLIQKWPIHVQPNGRWLARLVAELGESAEADLEEDYKQLRKELIQVAVVAVAWVEDIDRREKS